jgi:hypothetical protein
MNKKFPAFMLLVVLGISFAITSEAQTTRALFSNERFVIQAMRQIHSAQATYQATYGNGSFGSLADLRNAEFIDPVLASGSKYGYSFVMSVTPYTPGNPSSFRLTATPLSYPKTGRRSFFIDTSGEMRGADRNGEVATANDPYIDTCALFGSADNERCTIQDLRTLNSAESIYQSTYGNGVSYASLSQLGTAGLIFQVLATGQSHGYVFAVTVFAPTAQTPARFTVTAVPQTYGTTGVRSFFIDETGVIRGADHQGGPANENDPPINN